MSLSKAEFFALGACKVVEHKILGDGDVIKLRELTAGQQGEVVRLVRNKIDPAELQCRVIIMSALNGEGPMFTEADLPSLMAMKGDVINDIGSAAMSLSSLSGKKNDSAQNEDDSIG